MHILVTLLMIMGLFTAAHAQDASLTIEQIPENQVEKDGLEEGALLPEGVPERCADPDVASEDPACTPLQDEAADSYGLPLIEDTSEEKQEKLIPGVTINQGTPPSRLP